MTYDDVYNKIFQSLPLMPIGHSHELMSVFKIETRRERYLKQKYFVQI